MMVTRIFSCDGNLMRWYTKTKRSIIIRLPTMISPPIALNGSPWAAIYQLKPAHARVIVSNVSKIGLLSFAVIPKSYNNHLVKHKSDASCV